MDSVERAAARTGENAKSGAEIAPAPVGLVGPLVDQPEHLGDCLL
jgi:hypothetical protein